jgi:hypothetical protein
MKGMLTFLGDVASGLCPDKFVVKPGFLAIGRTLQPLCLGVFACHVPRGVNPHPKFSSLRQAVPACAYLCGALPRGGRGGEGKCS